MDQLTLLSSSCDEKEAENDVCRFVVWGVLGRYPSGQRGQTVNLLPSASKVRILACPPHQACMTWESRVIEYGITDCELPGVERKWAGVAQW